MWMAICSQSLVPKVVLKANHFGCGTYSIRTRNSSAPARAWRAPDSAKAGALRCRVCGSLMQDRRTQHRFDHKFGTGNVDEDLRRRLVVQHDGVERACVEQSLRFHAGCLACGQSASAILRVEVSRKEQTAGNAGLDRCALAEQRLVRLDTPAVGIAMIEIIERHRLVQHSSTGGHQCLSVSDGI